jgi:hypothetical protein
MPYNLTVIRELLMATFSDEELMIFCHDHFRAVYDQFTVGMGRLWKIHLLIEHCYRSEGFDELLARVKAANPVQYEKFESIIKVPQEVSEPASSSGERGQVEIVLGGDLSDITSGLQFALVGALAGILNIAPDQICVLEVSDGSLVLLMEMPTEAVDRLVALYRENDPVMQDLGIQQVRLDFTFQDQDGLCKAILDCWANHIELYGPCGVGKTYLLKHLTDKRPNARAVYIDLNDHPDVDEILQEVVTQLTGQRLQNPTTIEDLASTINHLRSLKTGQPINHFLFLFDSVTERHQEMIRWLISREGLINSQRFLALLAARGVTNIVSIQDQRGHVIDRFLDLTRPIGPTDVKLQVVIATRRPMVNPLIESFHPNFRFQQFAIDPLKKDLNPDKDPIQGMLRELASHRGIDDLIPSHFQNLGDEIYYITGGHPKCAKRVLFAVADADFVPESQQWRHFFEEHVLHTIEREMLRLITDVRLLEVFQILSIFRRFDQHVLRTLLKRKILPNDSRGGEEDSQAAQLRASLIRTYLVSDPDDREPMFTMNFAVRRALALRMRYGNPQTFRDLNHTAVEIFTEWLQNVRVKPERSIVSLIEIVYHQLNVLEMDLELGTDSALTIVEICTRVRDELDKHLQMLIETIDEDDLPKLKAYWEKDKELRETVERVTRDPQCYYILSRKIQNPVGTDL